ncbi:MAG: GlsB/YeaQ/YmgE family stress response membrane protein [Myxococcales bacterium]|nr:MAG: GlsB/YeaQ/YmgE family stress response membrane protein [Myxococcales bacterium]
MSLLVFLVFGFIVGLIARALMPGSQKMGILRTTLIGIAGSFIGGLIGNIIAGNALRVHSAGWIGSIIGAIVLLLILGRK